jgi:hypothetical protein
MRTVLRALLLVAALVVPAAACRGKPEIGFEIALPSSLTDTTAWFEVGAFRDAKCNALRPLLGGGIPDGATTRVAFKRDDKTGPRVGDIPRASYAFAAVARGDDCAVLATGCVEADVGETDSVLVPMAEVDSPTGACGVGASCQAARCVPANDNADPSVGAGCSLELLGSGPLANPVGGGGTLVSAPAVAATPDGFVAVYREVDPNGAGARLTILPLDSGGGAPDPLRPGLPGRCANSEESDGVGVAINGDSGMIALARAPCGAKPALELLNFKTTPEVGPFLVSTSPNDTRVLLSPARPVATRSAGNVVVYTEGGIARIANMDATKGIVGVARADAPTLGTFGGATAGLSDAWVAASESVLALLAAGKGAVAQPAPVDAGAEGGGGTVDAGGSDDPTLRLLVVPAATALTELDAATNRPRAPIVFPGEVGSIAARGSRVLVISDGGGPGRSATFRAFDLNKDAPAVTNGFSVDGQGKVTAVDVAVQGDRAYFVAMKPGALALHVYGSASTTPVPLRNLSFAREPRISGINTIRDGRVSVAATDTRVAVVWTTAKVLNNNDHTGGYAIFACTQ